MNYIIRMRERDFCVDLRIAYIVSPQSFVYDAFIDKKRFTHSTKNATLDKLTAKVKMAYYICSGHEETALTRIGNDFLLFLVQIFLKQ